MAQTIVVTGASRGIGKAIANYLISNGHNIVVTARSREPLQEIQMQAPRQVRILSGDIGDTTIASSIAKLAETEFGQVNGLIINHGSIAPVERIFDADFEAWKKHFDANFFGAVALVSIERETRNIGETELSKVKAFLPSLRKDQGKIIFTSSGAALHSYSGWGPYCASKAALKSIGDTLCLEEKEVITVSVVPGVVDTEMQEDLREKHLHILDEADQKRFGSLKIDKKLLKPEQPGHVIARLSLRASKELSGKILR